jgi:hypothetical protein
MSAGERLPVCRSRCIVLGASNVAMAMPTAVGLAQQCLPGPVDVMIAAGHGRSYVRTSRIPLRSLPGIEPCALWNDLSQRERATTYAVVTDVGNDLLYGETVGATLAAVEQCLARLSRLGARTVVTGLPIAGLPDLGPRRFEIFRRLFFPQSRYSLDEVKRLAIELDRDLAQLAKHYGCRWLAMQRKWYGFDPIHYRRCSASAIWEQLFAQLADENSLKNKGETLASRWRLALGCCVAAPAERTIVGIERRVRQPALKLRDASRVSLY